MRTVPSGIVAIAALVFAVSALADTVHMKNGDRATGELIKFEGSELFFDSEVTDEIEINLEDIESIETTRPVRVEFDDGTEVTGYIVLDAKGQMRLQDDPPPDKDKELPPAESATNGEPSGMLLDLSTVHFIEEKQTYYRYTASIEAGLNGASGNTDSTNVTASWDVQPAFGKSHLRANGQINRADADGSTTASNWRANQSYERDLTQKWFFTGLLNFDHDSLQDLDLRTTVGSGAGYRFFEPDPTLLKVILAPVFIKASYKNDDDEKYAALLWVLDFEQELWSDDLEFYHDHKVAAGLSDSTVTVVTTTGLKFDLISDFDLLVELQFDWTSEPADDAKSNDQRYLVKLAYEFEGDENDWWH